MTTTLRAMLVKARDQFAFYADQHRAKNTKDGDEKAATNERIAAQCDVALSMGSMTPFDDQAAFMRACGQTVGEANPVQAALYGKLVTEEYVELQEAIDADDQVEQADAVADLIVVLIGFAHSKGWPLDAVWAEVVRSNMAKVDPETGMVRRREDGKVLKPEGWTAPDIAGVLAAHRATKAAA